MDLCSNDIPEFNVPVCKPVQNTFRLVVKDGRYQIFDRSGNDVTDDFVLIRTVGGLPVFQHKNFDYRFG